jgi:hypothetical protein
MDVAHQVERIFIQFVVVGIPTIIITEFLSERPIIFSPHSKQLTTIFFIFTTKV